MLYLSSHSIREKENQRRLNKQSGLRSMESLFEDEEGKKPHTHMLVELLTEISYSIEGEMFEMGGIHDPEKGAMTYERRTEVTMQESDLGEKKRVKKIVEQTSWIGPDRGKKKRPKDLDEEEEEPPRPIQEEQNPLYSSREYISDFTNPIYTSQAEATASAAVLGTDSVELDDQMPLVTDSGGGDTDTKEVGMNEADTLF